MYWVSEEGATMISLTRKTDYALLALSHLAGEPGAVVCARDIAERYSVSTPLLMNVLKQLSAASLVNSVRGARGGYSLARSAEEITLAEVIDAIEGPVRLAPCLAGSGGDGERRPCDAGDNCPIQGPLNWLHGRLRVFFENVTLAEMARQGESVLVGSDRDGGSPR